MSLLNGRTKWLLVTYLFEKYSEIIKFSALGKSEDKVFAQPAIVKQPSKDALPIECDCPDINNYNYDYDPSKQLPQEGEAEQIINFENEIQNIVYVK